MSLSKLIGYDDPDRPDFLEATLCGVAPNLTMMLSWKRSCSPGEVQEAAVWLLEQTGDIKRMNREAEKIAEEDRRVTAAREAVAALPPKRRRKVLKEMVQEEPEEPEE